MTLHMMLLKVALVCAWISRRTGKLACHMHGRCGTVLAYDNSSCHGAVAMCVTVVLESTVLLMLKSILPPRSIRHG